MDFVVKGNRIVNGNCVLISCKDSGEIMRVRDADGCQIRLDGRVTDIADGWCRVHIKLMDRRGSNGIVLRTRLEDLELSVSEPNIWSLVNARGIDRKRKSGTDECDFWAPM